MISCLQYKNIINDLEMNFFKSAVVSLNRLTKIQSIVQANYFVELCMSLGMIFVLDVR